MYACFVSIVLVVVVVLVLSVVVLLLVVRYTLSGFLRCSITFVTHARTRHKACTCQGVVTLIRPVEPFATGIKMKSSDQEAI